MSLTAHRFFSENATAGDPQAEAAFFAPLKMRNGTFKLTRPSRFAEIEAALAPVFRARAAGIETVMDIGVSSGVTSIEFLDFLEREGARPALTATDLFLRAHLVEAAPGLRVLADPHGFPLQYDLAGRAIRAWTRRLDFATLAALPLLLARSVLGRRARALIAQGRSRPVLLASPRLLARRGVELVEDDILVRRPDFTGRYDVVRAANILNAGYFRPEALDRAIGNVLSYLKGPGALFLVTRTGETGGNAGTLFELGTNGRFTVVQRIGAGSEIEARVLG